MQFCRARSHQLGSSTAFAGAGGGLRVRVLGLRCQQPLQVVQALERARRVGPDQDGDAVQREVAPVQLMRLLTCNIRRDRR